MATTTKKQDLEIHFLSLELAPALKLPRHSNHLLSISLVCPRLAVARKSAERTVTLDSGEVLRFEDKYAFCEYVENRW